MKKILLVADIRGWAFDNIAKYVSQTLDGTYFVDIIYVGDYDNFDDFLVALNNLEIKFDLIHFFYRLYLNELIIGLGNKNHPAMTFKALLEVAVTTVIPEGRFLDQDSLLRNKLVFDFVDNYYTVSKKFLLTDIYFLHRKICMLYYFFKSKIQKAVALFRSFKLFIHKKFMNEEATFAYIYETDYWTNGSGQGSKKSNTVEYRKLLQKYFDDPAFKTYTDLGCGDWQIMKLITIPEDKKYYGYDIVNSVIEKNKQDFSKENTFFYHCPDVNAINSADLLIIKDVLMHWPNKKIQYFVKNILPRFKFALITDDAGEKRLNHDISYGEWSPVDLRSPPFNVKDIEVIMKYKNSGGNKSVYLYTNPDNIKS